MRGLHTPGVQLRDALPTATGSPMPHAHGRKPSEAVKVPGALAPTISVPGFWHALPSMVLKARSAFASFLRSLLSAGNNPAPTSSVWPCPVPYPEVFRKGPQAQDSWRKKQASMVVAMLSWLHLGGPVQAPPEILLGTRLSAQQWRMIRSMEARMLDDSVLSDIVAGDMGRTASKLEDQHLVLAALSRATASFEDSHTYFARPNRAFFKSASAAGVSELSAEKPSFGKAVGSLREGTACAAKPIQASRLSFPPPPAFEPRGFLDSHTVERYENPLEFSASPNPLIMKLPHVQVLASREEKLRLYGPRLLGAIGAGGGSSGAHSVRCRIVFSRERP